MQNQIENRRLDAARLAATHVVEPGLAGERVDYVGPAVYRSGRLEMVRFGGGYATVNGKQTLIEFEVDFAPFQPSACDANTLIPTATIRHNGVKQDEK